MPLNAGGIPPLDTSPEQDNFRKGIKMKYTKPHRPLALPRALQPIVSLCLLIALSSGLAQAELRVSMSEALKAAVKRPTPADSPIAKQMRVAGDVEVEVNITKEGDVENVKVLSGNALLTAPVVKAVKEWKFSPFASEAVTQLKFTFKPE
jgi:TonB family protein